MRKNSRIIGKSMLWTERDPVNGLFDINDVYNYRLDENWPTVGKYLSHSLSPGTTVQEGSSLIMTVTTEGFEDGELLYYTINTVSGPTMTGADFNDGNISGSFAVTNNSGALTKELVQTDTEEFNVMNIDIRFGSVSGPIQDTTSDITITDIEDVIGQTLYTSGSNSWTCPANVTSVHVLCIGGGGGGGAYTYNYDIMGGGGGALAWRNNIPTTPGNSYTAYVGSGGYGGSYYNSNWQRNNGSGGNQSYFMNTNTLRASGGSGGYYNTTYGGSYSAPGGGGGNGGNSYEYGNGPAGGGGAGGYTGTGGQGRQYNSYPSAGSGGGGGGGYENYSNYNQTSGYGGGVGYFGKSNNGASGSSSTEYGQPGSIQNIGSSGQGHGGTHVSYGRGGRASTYYYSSGGTGGSGIVRIIWGQTRAWPDTETWDIT